MNTRDYNKAVTLLIHLIVINNAGAVARALKQAGYDVKSYIPAPELEMALLQLQMADTVKFFSLMQSIPWNYGDTETNKPEVRDELMKLVAAQSSIEITKDNWWKILLAMVDSRIPAQSTCDRSINEKHFGIFKIAAIVAIIIVIIYIVRTI